MIKFSEPTINDVSDMKASVVDLFEESCLTLIFTDKRGNKVELETYWQGAEAMKRAEQLCDAINGVTAPLATVEPFPSDSHLDAALDAVRDTKEFA